MQDNQSRSHPILGHNIGRIFGTIKSNHDFPYRQMRQREGRGDCKEVGDREDNNLGSVKMKITPFQGRANPETYLEEEKKR